MPDCDDGQVWVQSDIAPTWQLPRALDDKFSFSDTNLVAISNRGEGLATCILEGIECAEGAIYCASTRRAGFSLREREQRTLLLKPGEVLTLRSYHAREPVTDSEGRPVPIRPGQVTA